MCVSARRIAIGILAFGVFAGLACTAAASRLVISEQGFRLAYRSFEVNQVGTIVRCPLTLEGSFSSESFPKTSGLRVASISRATLSEGACTNGTMRLLSETLPWAVQYASFTGTLPEIRSVALHLLGAAMRITERVFEISCLATSEAAKPVVLTAEPIREFQIEGLAASGSIPTGCSFEDSTSGSGTVTVAGGSGPVLVFLEDGTRGDWSIRFDELRGPPRRNIVTFMYGGAGAPNVTAVNVSDGWTLERTECVRRFANGTECRVTATPEESAPTGSARLIERRRLLVSGTLMR